MNKKLIQFSFLSLFIAITIQVPNAFAQGKSHTDPAAIGTSVSSIVQIGPMNTINYDVMIIVIETIRGKQAIKHLQSLNSKNKKPEAGFEYLLARIKFELQGRAVSDTGSFELSSSPFQWVAFSSGFRQYENISVTPPKPVLKGIVASGQSVEGWLVFEVEQSEAEPIMMFDPASGGGMGRGSKLFFKLY